LKSSELREIIREEIADWQRELKKQESFKLGTPAIYKNRSGEVALNRKPYRHKNKLNEPTSKPGTIKGILLYPDSNYAGHDRIFVVPDTWLDVKKF